MSKVDILNTFFVRINVDIIFLKIMQQSFICNPFLKIFNCTYITINLYLSIKVIYQTFVPNFFKYYFPLNIQILRKITSRFLNKFLILKSSN